MSTTDSRPPAIAAVPGPKPELTVVEQAAVLRACREKRNDLRQALDHLRTQAHLGDRTANAAGTVVDAELSILEAAIRALWKQSGCDPPVGW